MKNLLHRLLLNLPQALACNILYISTFTNIHIRQINTQLVLQTLLILFISPVTIYAQDLRLPQYSNGNYGIVDDKGKVILNTIYDDVIIHDHHKVICALKDDLWAVYTLDGIRLLDHVIKNNSSFRTGITGPVFSELTVSNTIYNRKKIVKTGLLACNDSYAKVKYFINPNAPLDTYKPYGQKMKRAKLSSVYYKTHINNNYTITTRDDKFMSIDSTGKERMSSGKEEAVILSNNLIAVGENKLYAVYKDNTQLTNFIYKQFYVLEAGGLIYGTCTVTDENDKPKSEYHLFDSEGKVFVKSNSAFTSRDNLIIANDINGKSVIYDSDLKTKLSYDSLSMSFVKLGTKLYIKSADERANTDKNRYRSEKKISLYNIGGELILDPIYSSIEKSKNHLYCKYDNTIAILDSNLNVVIELDSVYALKVTDKPGVFKYTIENNYSYLNGLMDVNKKVIIPAKYPFVSVYPCNDLVSLATKDSFFLVNYKNSNILESSSNKYIEVSCIKESYTVLIDSEVVKKDFNGNVVKVLSKNRLRQPEVSTKYQSIKQDKFYILADSTGNAVDNTRYKKIEKITDPKTQKTAYLCVFESNKHPSCIVFNDNLEKITPPGYSISERWVRYMKHNKGTIFVGNDADIAKNRYSFHSGIIDFDGNWVVKPFLGLFTFIDDGVFLVTDYDQKKYIFYNAKGEIVNTRDYDIIEKSSGSDYFQNRIPVGILTDRSYIKKVEEVTKTFDNDIDIKGDTDVALAKMEKNLSKIEAIGKPDVLYGYVNKQGEEIIPPKYISATTFGMSKAYATVSERDKNGNVSTHMIDTLDNKIVSVPYESLIPLYGGYYVCKSNGRFGISDSIGTAMTPFQWDRLELSIVGKNICTASDSASNYLIDAQFNIIPLEESDKIEAKHLDDSYFYVKLSNKIPDTYKYVDKYYIYSYENNLVASFDDITSISIKFNRKDLPKDYMSIVRKSSAKPVIFNLKRMRYLEE
jgi:hypothetical protein